MKYKKIFFLGILNIFWYLFVIVAFYLPIPFFKSSIELIIFSSFINFSIGIFNIFMFLEVNKN